LQFTLANGLRVRLVPAHDEPKVVVLLGVRAGFFDEPAGVPHVAHVTEHLVVFGARPGSEEQKAVARWYAAGQANAETLADFMYFDLHVPPEELDLALRVQAGRLAGAQLSRETLGQEIPRTLAEIDFLERSEVGGTGKFAFCPFVQAAFHGATDARLKARTRAMTREQVQTLYERTFRADRASLYIIGDLKPAEARKAVEAAFRAVPKQSTTALEARARPKSGTRTVRWDATTRHLVLGWPAPASSDPDHRALTLASFVLMQRLYMDTEIAPLAKMPFVSNEVEGFFLVNVQAKPSADIDALKDLLLKKVTRLASPEGLGDADLAQARLVFAQLTQPVNLDAVPLPPNVSKMMARANIELQKMMREAVWGDLPGYAKRVAALDAAGVRAALRRHLGAEGAVIVRIEPAGE
jgi:zinc protease